MLKSLRRNINTNSDYRIYRSKHLRLGIVVRVPMYNSKPESRD